MRRPQSDENDDNTIRVIRYFMLHYHYRCCIQNNSITISRFKLGSGGDMQYKFRLYLVSKRNDHWLNNHIPEIVIFQRARFKNTACGRHMQAPLLNMKIFHQSSVQPDQAIEWNNSNANKLENLTGPSSHNEKNNINASW